MSLIRILVATVALLLAATASARTIVLIGGNTPHGPGVHESEGAVRLIEQYLNTSPDLTGRNRLRVKAYPDGWPGDPTALDDAATVVWYFEGLQHHPLLDPTRRARFAQLMAKGVGLVVLHQAGTLPPDDRDVDLIGWLGATRYGMVDRTTEPVAFTPVRHPVTRGVQSFAYRDEFYPSLRFRTDRITPILTAPLHLEAAPGLPPTQRTVAWTYDRADGGRSFGFTGLHYLASLEQPELRKLLLNAILWTAKAEVPKRGVRTNGERAR